MTLIIIYFRKSFEKKNKFLKTFFFQKKVKKIFFLFLKNFTRKQKIKKIKISKLFSFKRK
jgi:hypothetical protein